MKFVIALFLILLQFGCGPSYLSLVNDIQAGNTEKIRSYLEHGGDVNQTGPMFGSLLAIAVEFNQLEIVKLLIDRDAQVEPQDPNVERPFCMLIKNGSGPTAEEIFKVLLNHGAKFNKRCQANVSNFVGLINNKMWRSATLLMEKVNPPFDNTFLDTVIKGVNEDSSGAPVPFLNKYLKYIMTKDEAVGGQIFLSIIYASRFDLIDAFKDFGGIFLNNKYSNPTYGPKKISAGELIALLKVEFLDKAKQLSNIEKKLISFGMNPVQLPSPPDYPSTFGKMPDNWNQIDPVLQDAGKESWQKAPVKYIEWWDPPVAGNVNDAPKIKAFCQAILLSYPPKKDGGLNSKLFLLLHPDKYKRQLVDGLGLNGAELKFAENTFAARFNLVQSCYKHVTGGK